ncbi:MerR family DNA-binding transcriptional regulator [Polymorphospora sp. NPDC050346]|uniref:MerR family DNA-binding transcriptional regulator n=1 Tax=Polymorphospora sp. NPDC050346 TaxID=3155780 RepID=UPI0033E303A7
MKDDLTAGEFQAITGLSAKALRLYAERGILVPASVAPHSGYRHCAFTTPARDDRRSPASRPGALVRAGLGRRLPVRLEFVTQGSVHRGPNRFRTPAVAHRFEGFAASSYEYREQVFTDGSTIPFMA